MSTSLRIAGTAALALALTACGSASDKPTAVKPAKSELLAHESELLKLTLTPEAETRLGLRTAIAGSGSAPRMRSVQGEIVLPAVAGALPVGAGADLAGLAAAQVRNDAEVARARAEVTLAAANARRADALVREEAGSVRQRDEAVSALAAANAALRAARDQRALLGPGVAALSRGRGRWVRVAVYAGDLGAIDRTARARVRGLGGEAGVVTARPVAGPPSANAAAATVDLWYALDDSAVAFRVGQRVAVDLPERAGSTGLMVPTSAILYDIHGGEWVYVQSGPRAYERRRVEVTAMAGGRALLRRGLTPGARVVTAGAAELFGTEFGAK